MFVFKSVLSESKTNKVSMLASSYIIVFTGDHQQNPQAIHHWPSPLEEFTENFHVHCNWGAHEHF